MTWEPIETAPRGQTIVGLRANPIGKQPALVGEIWNFAGSDWTHVMDRWTGRGSRCTHWMPLPKPPEASDG